MIVEAFQPPFDWIVREGVESQGLVKHFETLYRRYSDVFDLHLLTEANRTKEARDFSNIGFNAMMKLVVMDAITDMLEIDPDTKNKLCRATIVPNWNLHMTKRPQDFLPEAIERLGKIGEGVKCDTTLVSAAGPDFFTSGRVDQEDVTREELLMLLVSDLVDEREIGKPTIMDVDAHIDFKEIERADLGAEYWQRERSKDHEIMDTYFPGLPYNRLPSMILNHVAKKVI